MPEFSIIIPLYNRPEEINELLGSLLSVENIATAEVIVVEDGSSNPSKNIVQSYADRLNIVYIEQENAGPGPARNRGAKNAQAEWLIFFDSDCLIPENYLLIVREAIEKYEFDAFGGPDSANPNFTATQKAINYSMTSFITTGGIRGGAKQLEDFKPRSFNMGMKKVVYDKLKGFKPIRFGEDVDLSLRLKENGYNAKLLKDAFVYHKRRTSFRQFFKQIFNSGMARVYLSKQHSNSLRLVHTLPLGFLIFTLLSLLSPVLGIPLYWGWLIVVLAISIDSLIRNGSMNITFLSIVASLVQLYGYALGFAYATMQILIGKSQSFSFEKSLYD